MPVKIVSIPPPESKLHALLKVWGIPKIIPAHGGHIIVKKLSNGKEVGFFEPDVEKVRRMVREKIKRGVAG
jgi:hypothetical protein